MSRDENSLYAVVDCLNRSVALLRTQSAQTGIEITEHHPKNYIDKSGYLMWNTWFMLSWPWLYGDTARTTVFLDFTEPPPAGVVTIRMRTVAEIFRAGKDSDFAAVKNKEFNWDELRQLDLPKLILDEIEWGKARIAEHG